MGGGQSLAWSSEAAKVRLTSKMQLMRRCCCRLSARDKDKRSSRHWMTQKTYMPVKHGRCGPTRRIPMYNIIRTNLQNSPEAPSEDGSYRNIKQKLQRPQLFRMLS